MIEYTAGQIAAFLEGTVEGDIEAKVSHLSKIEDANPGSITFLSNPAYTPFIYTTHATITLVSESFTPDQPLNCTIIRVKDPYGALAKLLEMYQKSLPVKSGISELAFISDKASLGGNNYIGAFSYIGDNVSIGDNVKLYPHCFIGDHVSIGNNTCLYSGVKIYDNCQIGENCTIHANAVIGADGFGFAPQAESGFRKVYQIGNVIIEDHVEIGAGTAIDRATLGSTIIRKGVKLDNLIQIGHNVVVGENTVMAGQVGVAGSTKIGSNCMIGGQVGIAGHLTIGDDVKIGAQSGISNNIKSGEIRLGSPAIDIAKYKKSAVHFRNLDNIVDRLEKLEDKLKNS